MKTGFLLVTRSRTMSSKAKPRRDGKTIDFDGATSGRCNAYPDLHRIFTLAKASPTFNDLLLSQQPLRERLDLLAKD